MTENSYTKQYSDGLLYSQSPTLLEGIVERRADRFFPRTARTAKASDTIEFEISTDQFLDLSTGAISFDLGVYVDNTFASTTGMTVPAISNITDLIQQHEIWYNDVSVERVGDSNTWTNMFLATGGNKAWADTEASALLGLTNQFTSAKSGGVAYNNARSYIIPLSMFSGFCRSKNYLPIVGNKIRISLLLARDIDVLNLQVATTNAFQLTNISLLCDTVITQSNYRQKIINAMASPSGLRIPFTSYQTGRVSCTATVDQYFQIQNNLSNSLSLHLLHSPEASKVASITNWTLFKESYPLPMTGGLFTVKCGSKWFTPSDGVKGFNEAYVSLNKTTQSGIFDVAGIGMLDYSTFTGGYTKATTITSANYGFCPLSVNLEKTISSDDNTINEGVNSLTNGATNYFDIRINTNATALLATDILLYNLVHKRALIFKQSGVSCDF